jgi:hypothetical protein
MRLCVSASVAIIALISGAASGQTRSSFQNVDGFSALTVVENNTLSYTVSMGANPVVRVGGIDYAITTVFGFWSLSDDDNFSAASGSGFGVWSLDASNSGAGAIAGWKTNPNMGILPNGSETFNYLNLSVGQRERFGFHISTASIVPGQQGLTFYATGPSIPAPGSLGMLAGAGLLAVRRRRA